LEWPAKRIVQVTKWLKCTLERRDKKECERVREEPEKVLE